MSTTAPAPAPPALLINVHAVGRELLGVSESQVWKLSREGKMPAPVRLGHRITRWNRDEIVAWIEAGCPDRATWEALKTGASA